MSQCAQYHIIVRTLARPQRDFRPILHDSALVDCVDDQHRGEKHDEYKTNFAKREGLAREKFCKHDYRVIFIGLVGHHTNAIKIELLPAAVLVMRVYTVDKYVGTRLPCGPSKTRLYFYIHLPVKGNCLYHESRIIHPTYSSRSQVHQSASEAWG